MFHTNWYSWLIYIVLANDHLLEAIFLRLAWKTIIRSGLETGSVRSYVGNVLQCPHSSFRGSSDSVLFHEMMADFNKPIVPAPAGYLVDLDNPQRRGQTIITYIRILGMLIATMLLVIRANTKLVYVKKVSSDDCEFYLQRTEESSLV
jgi:hypothetical protein